PHPTTWRGCSSQSQVLPFFSELPYGYRWDLYSSPCAGVRCLPVLKSKRRDNERPCGMRFRFEFHVRHGRMGRNSRRRQIVRCSFAYGAAHRRCKVRHIGCWICSHNEGPHTVSMKALSFEEVCSWSPASSIKGRALQFTARSVEERRGEDLRHPEEAISGPRMPCGVQLQIPSRLGPCALIASQFYSTPWQRQFGESSR
ncbi:hypothetical protein H257_19041, partial [Aphanomyces astaci]